MMSLRYSPLSGTIISQSFLRGHDDLTIQPLGSGHLKSDKISDQKGTISHSENVVLEHLGHFK